MWEGHLAEAHPALDFSRFPWIQNVVFNRLTLRKIMAARLNIGSNALDKRPLYSETRAYLMLFGVDFAFHPPTPPAVFVAPGEPIPEARRGGPFSFLVRGGEPVDDGAFDLQEKLDRAVARGYPAVVDGVPTVNIPLERMHSRASCPTSAQSLPY